MFKLDHITILAPSLEVGREYIRETLGVEMQTGGKHPQMSTHNLLLRLGDEVFLEVIAIDPDASPVPHPRWFGLDDTAGIVTSWEKGHRLRAWVAQTNDMAEAVASHRAIIGDPKRISRGDRTWLFAIPADGSLPAEGVAPSIIDWEERGNPVSAMIDVGAKLLSLEIEHPDPSHVSEIYDRMQIANPPKVIEGDAFRYRAVIDTPNGLKILF